MLELTEWMASTRFPGKPWLILGKGPSFSRRSEFDLSEFNLLSLNHAVLEERVDVAHIVDVSVVEDCADALLQNSRFVLMPRHPHIAYAASSARLEDFVPHVPSLQELDRQGRLVWYNAATGDSEGSSPVIDLRYFSSEAALSILGHLGARVVRSLGVDGSRSYSASFQTLSAANLLRNGRSSFNAQFSRLDGIAERHRIDYRPLVPPLRIFIGTDPAQRVAAEVLEHSLQKHATSPIRVDFLDQPVEQKPRHPRNRPRTPFSFNRFLIPAATGYEGRALYLDSDMLVFGDVTELFALPLDSNAVLCTRQPDPPVQWKDHPDFKTGRQFSVMLIDCSRARWDIEAILTDLDAGRFTYEELMFDMAVVPEDEIGESIPPAWNHLERFEPNVTKLLHYTVVPTQPWRNDSNPLRSIWLHAFQEAVSEGAVDRQGLGRAARRGAVAQDLLDLADRIPDPEISEHRLTPTEIELRALRAQLAGRDRQRSGGGPLVSSRRWVARTARGRRHRT